MDTVCMISGSFEVKDLDDSSDSESGSSTGFVDGQDLCLPALSYLRQCCEMIASMSRMPACPVFTGAQRSVSLAFTSLSYTPVLWSFVLAFTITHIRINARRPNIVGMLHFWWYRVPDTDSGSLVPFPHHYGLGDLRTFVVQSLADLYSTL